MKSDPYFPNLIKQLQRQRSFGIKTNVLINESLSCQEQEEAKESLFENCGMLVSIWYDQQQQTSVNYATAFSVSKHIIVTTTSNIYQHQRNQFAARIFYYPNVDISLQYCMEMHERVGKYYYVYEEKCIRSSILCTNKNNLALICLERGLKHTSFLKIGGLPSQYDKKVKIVGYSCSEYPKQFVQKKVTARRGEVDCQVENEGYVLEHSYCAHQMGKFSGSPIVVKNNKGEFYAVGMKINSPKKGIYFNDDIVKTIRQMEKEFLQPLSLPLGLQAQRSEAQIEKVEQIQENMYSENQANMDSQSVGQNMSEMDIQDLEDFLKLNPTKKNFFQDQLSLDESLVQK